MFLTMCIVTILRRSRSYTDRSECCSHGVFSVVGSERLSMSGNAWSGVDRNVRRADHHGREEYVFEANRITHCHGDVWVLCPC